MVCGCDSQAWVCTPVVLAIRGPQGHPVCAHGLCAASFWGAHLTGCAGLTTRAQEVWKARDRFCESQQPRIDALWRFVQEQRVRRRQARPAAQQWGSI